MTAGAGHRRAAEAIAQAAARHFPEAEVRCVDVLTYAPGRFHALYAWSYLLLVRHLPWIWQVSYRLVDGWLGYRLNQPLRWRWNLAITRRFTAMLKAQPPDLIVTTHFLPADVCSTAKRAGWLRVPLAVVITDLHPHRFWMSREAEAVVVSTDEGRATLERRGIDPARIHVIGIPIGPAFSEPADRRAIGKRLGLDPGRLTVLVTSGGTTVGQFERVVRSLAALDREMPKRVQLLVVCGMDDAAKERLTQFVQRTAVPMCVFGFVSYMADLMAVSDLMVAKAGGLTVTEALARALPMVLYHVIPGQERLNAEYVARQGAAVIAPQPAQVIRAVRRCLEEPSRLEGMRRAAASLAHPHAAEEIVCKVIEPLMKQTSCNVKR
ncbi:MAG: UDP-N-acetylglucosamine 2-epimerase [Candidatus Omnitrophica bacterium]|nr:UDP-N-acetylglucosamine 2-epimerase [Candidatus Omnitrophota bacterium]